MPANTKDLATANGNKPAPQYYNAATDTYEHVKGQNGGPFATILGPNGQPISSTNGLPVQLTGRNVERVWIQDIQPRDTTALLLPKLDVSKYKQVSFWLKSTLNQAVSVKVRNADPSTGRAIIMVWDGAAWKRLETSISVTAANGDALLLNSIFPELNDMGMGEITLELQCPVAPTSGYLKVWYEGVPN